MTEEKCDPQERLRSMYINNINYLFLNILIYHSLHFCISLMINGIIAIIIMIYVFIDDRNFRL